MNQQLEVEGHTRTFIEGRSAITLSRLIEADVLAAAELQFDLATFLDPRIHGLIEPSTQGVRFTEENRISLNKVQGFFSFDCAEEVSDTFRRYGKKDIDAPAIMRVMDVYRQDNTQVAHFVEGFQDELLGNHRAINIPQLEVILELEKRYPPSNSEREAIIKSAISNVLEDANSSLHPLVRERLTSLYQSHSGVPFDFLFSFLREDVDQYKSIQESPDDSVVVQKYLNAYRKDFEENARCIVLKDIFGSEDLSYRLIDLSIHPLMRQESLRREIIDLADIEDRPFTEKRSDHELVAFFNMVTQRLFTRAVSDTLLATPERDKVLADINSFLGRINDYASVTIGSLLAGKPCDFANVSDQIAIEYTPAVQVNQLSENTPVFVENIRCPGFVTVDPEGNRGVTLMIGNKKDNYSFLSPPYFFTLPRVQGDVSLIVSPKNFSLELLQKQFSPDEVSA